MAATTGVRSTSGVEQRVPSRLADSACAAVFHSRKFLDVRAGYERVGLSADEYRGTNRFVGLEALEERDELVLHGARDDVDARRVSQNDNRDTVFDSQERPSWVEADVDVGCEIN
jgi:hypothetical protein